MLPRPTFRPLHPPWLCLQRLWDPPSFRVCGSRSLPAPLGRGGVEGEAAWVWGARCFPPVASVLAPRTRGPCSLAGGGVRLTAHRAQGLWEPACKTLSNSPCPQFPGRGGGGRAD